MREVQRENESLTCVKHGTWYEWSPDLACKNLGQARCIICFDLTNIHIILIGCYEDVKTQIKTAFGNITM